MELRKSGKESDAPRTDACPYCGSDREVDSFFRTTCGNLLDFREGNIGKIAGERTDLCHEIEVSNLWRKRAEKAEAEVERLRGSIKCVAWVLKSYNPKYAEEIEESLNPPTEPHNERAEKAEAEVERLKVILGNYKIPS
jgi:hypothetical protein